MKRVLGPDKILNEAIKSATKKVKTKLLNIIKLCLIHKYFPRKWKTTHIIAIHKRNTNTLIPKRLNEEPRKNVCVCVSFRNITTQICKQII